MPSIPKKYFSYEPSITGAYTEREMENLYLSEVDKAEYPDYECWIHDMLKSGVFETI